MRPGPSRLVPVTVFTLCVLSAGFTVVLLVAGAGDSTPGDAEGMSQWGGLNYVLLSLTFGTVGSLVVARLPANRVGWVLCLLGVGIGTGDLAFQYADQALYGSWRSLPGGTFAAWYQNLGLAPTFGLLGLSLLLFPDGRLPSRRWWPAAALAIAGITCVETGYALRPGPLDAPFRTITNPLGVPGAFGLTDWLNGTGWLLTGASVAAAAWSLRARSRHARGLERQQLRWVTLAASVSGVIIVVDVASFFLSVSGINQLRDVALGLAMMTFPLAIGAAILRYRLYDIDVVINRTLVYAALTATLAGVYLASILLLQLALSAFTAGSGLAVAVSTLATAALVRPVRDRIQQIVDRRFFRRRYDAARTLERFGAHVRDEVDLDAVVTELRAVVAETLQPAHLALWTPRARR